MVQTVSAAVSAGHALVADIAWDILGAGGNATDAGVAAVLALSVVHSEQVQLGGTAPMLVRPPDGDVIALDGVGRWPAATDPEHFARACKGRVPRGILRTVTPALPDACVTALARFGTMPFADLAEPAWRLAAEGFPAHADLAAASAQYVRHYRALPANAAIWLPDDRPIEVGSHFVQPALADTLQRLIHADRQASKRAGRAAGLAAVRQAFYDGDLANEMAAHAQQQGGWLSAEDLRAHHTEVSPAARGAVFGGALFTHGPSSQGPSLTQALQIFDVLAGPSPQDRGPRFWHPLFQAIELAMKDRDLHYGDPDFVDVDLSALLDPRHAEALAATVQAAPNPRAETPPSAEIDPADTSIDTSVVTVADGAGGVFVATPSDQSHDAPAVPGLGFVMSTRGGQSYVDAAHPASVRPGKRPRISACPFLFEAADGRIIAGGGPGADLLIQSATQVLARHLGAGRSLLDALAQPRAFTLAPPGSSEPHICFPGKVTVEEELSEAEFDAIAALGYTPVRTRIPLAGRPSLCIVETDPRTGRAAAYGDPRRHSGQRAGDPQA